MPMLAERIWTNPINPFFCYHHEYEIIDLHYLANFFDHYSVLFVIIRKFNVVLNNPLL